MTQRQFERGVLADVAGAALGASAIIGLGLVAPGWVVGVACIVLIPAFVAAVFLHTFTSHRWDESQPGTDHAHTSENEPAHSPATPPTTHGPADLSSGGPVRPNVVTAWVDFAWACHWAALHPYSVTRPGR